MDYREGQGMNIISGSIKKLRKIQCRSIKHKINGVLIFLIIALVTVNLINCFYYRNTVQKYKDIVNVFMEENTIMMSTMNIRQTLREIIVDSKDTEKLNAYQEYKQNMFELEKKIGKGIDENVNTSRTVLFSQMNKFIDIADILVAKAKDYDVTAAEEYDKVSKVSDFMRENSIELTNNELIYTESLIKEIEHISELSQNISYAIIILVVIVCTLLTFITVRNIIKSLNKLINVSEKIAAGKLSTKQFEVNSKDEIGILSNSINIMQKNLFKMVKLISINGNHMHTTLISLDDFIKESSKTGEQLV